MTFERLFNQSRHGKLKKTCGSSYRVGMCYVINRFLLELRFDVREF